MKLLNLSVGFTTPSEIGKLNPEKQAVIIPPTAYIADGSLSALQAFQQSGGRVVLVGSQQSFLKDEAGKVRPTGGAIQSPFASLAYDETYEMIAPLSDARSPLRPATPIDVAVSDENGAHALGVLLNQATDPQIEKPPLIMNNMSKDRRVFDLASRGTKGRVLGCDHAATRATAYEDGAM